MAKYDWNVIKTQFITSSLTIEEFATQNAIPVGTLRRQVSKGNTKTIFGMTTNWDVFSV